MKVKLGLKIIFVNLATILVFLAVSAVLFITLRKLEENEGWVTHTYDVIEMGNSLLSSMVDMETGMRGFLITGVDEYLDPYKGGNIAFSEQMKKLQKKVEDNEKQVKRLKGVDQSANNWINQVAEPFILMRREIVLNDNLIKKVTARMTEGEGKSRMDRLRAALNAFSSDETSILIIEDMINMETGLRGFIATKDESFLEPYNVGKSRISGNLRGLNSSRVTEYANDWIDNYAEVQIKDVTSSLEYKNREFMYAEMEKKAGKVFMDQIRADIADFINAESELLTIRSEVAETQRTTAEFTIILGFVVAMIIAFTLSILVTKNITRQIGGEPEEIAQIVQDVASGDLNVRFDNRVAVGIYDYMKQMVNKLSEIVAVVVSGSSQIVSASTELSSGNQDLSRRTEQQATALEETSSAIEEMNSSIKSNAHSTGSADQLSRTAVQKTEEGTRAVNQMISSMNEISDSSTRIANIIEVINNIAFQTNLLALNASIEAARAGEQGKGFAVVAVEVRKLAKRSDKAAAEIAEIIKNSNKKVTEGVDIANTAGSMLKEINDAVKKVTVIVGEISASSQEQLASVDQIDRTLASLDENTQKNASMVEEAAAATEELSAQARELNSHIQFFRLNR